MTNFKCFFLNGTKYSIMTNVTIDKIVQYFNYHTKLSVLEYNGLICNKKIWNTIQLKNNDKIEIVTIVGGG